MRLISILISVIFLPQCVKKTENLLKQKLIDEGVIDHTTLVYVLNDSQKTRENEYVVKVSGIDLQVKQVIEDKFKKIELARINELELVEHLIGRKLLAQNASWKDRVYVRICEKDGTLIYIVVLSSNESIIFLSYR